MKELPSPELIENRRRSVAMLTPGVPALSREEALELLQAALHKVRRLRALKEPT
jgi:hypothetical protein